MCFHEAFLAVTPPMSIVWLFNHFLWSPNPRAPLDDWSLKSEKKRVQDTPIGTLTLWMTPCWERIEEDRGTGQLLLHFDPHNSNIRLWSVCLSHLRVLSSPSTCRIRTSNVHVFYLKMLHIMSALKKNKNKLYCGHSTKTRIKEMTRSKILLLLLLLMQLHRGQPYLQN